MDGKQMVTKGDLSTKCVGEAPANPTTKSQVLTGCGAGAAYPTVGLNRGATLFFDVCS